eukprot:scaffold10715_cov114-Isochrysis_galbana.AAC.17
MPCRAWPAQTSETAGIAFPHSEVGLAIESCEHSPGPGRLEVEDARVSPQLVGKRVGRFGRPLAAPHNSKHTHGQPAVLHFCQLEPSALVRRGRFGQAQRVEAASRVPQSRAPAGRHLARQSGQKQQAPVTEGNGADRVE